MLSMSLEAKIATGAVLDRSRFFHKVISRRDLTDTAFVLRFERGDLRFDPGQYISVGPADDINMREYSIYSGVDDPYLEIIVREVEGGYVSRKLRKLDTGDQVYVEGPFGFFLIEDHMRAAPLYFIASGTGISPFHNFSRSFKALDYTILHGMRFLNERFEQESYDPGRYVACVSREEISAVSPALYRGRVTSWLRTAPDGTERRLPADGYYFLCGNCDMIYEVYDILASKGVPADHMFAEVYF
jgi:ferredoxin--NADP+ reductase